MNCYDWPQYWDLAFDDDTHLEADFVEAASRKYCSFPVKRLLEPGCGGGRLVLELARRGYDVSACDLSAAAVDYARARVAAANLTADVAVHDMRQLSCDPKADVAYCLVNTFRHLLTEEDAAQHLHAVAQSVRTGGLYLIGMHLLPPDADEEDNEEWSVSRDGMTVTMQLDVANCDRTTRLETLKFRMEAVTANSDSPQCFETDYQMRIYRAHQFEELIKRVPAFELIDVYDFWYDIEEPLRLSDEMGDTVFVLRRS
ncbi:MAG: class I SAM-dependent methyltransferase [Fuerstiella sp.]|nr:class I SAM-dependent methyltransferase [Fuerstiella sp.]